MPDLIQRIYRAFEPGPLTADQTALYVDLRDVRGDADVVRRLKERILLSDQPTCQILTGHRGSGKSTELKRLQQALETDVRRLFVVYCQADEDVDRNDVDFPDILVTLVRQTATQLRERAGIELKAGYFRERWEELRTLLGSNVQLEGASLETGLLKVSATIKGSPDARAKIRQLLEPNTGGLLDAANDVLRDASEQLGRNGQGGLAIIVDDLDKMVLRPHGSTGCSTGEYLFVHREAQLSAFACHIVYTMPIALAYSGLEQTIANLYGGHVPVLPMIKVQTRPSIPPGQSGGTPVTSAWAAGYSKLRTLVEKRLEHAEAEPASVFASDDVCDELIRLSGGQPRELMILIREALIVGNLPIDMLAVNRAAREGLRAYARQLRKEHLPLLDEVRRTGTFERTKENDEVVRDLLDSRAILQYINDDEWYSVNPLVPNATARADG